MGFPCGREKHQIIEQRRVHVSQIVKTATSVDSYVGYSAVRRLLHGRLAVRESGWFWNVLPHVGGWFCKTS